MSMPSMKRRKKRPDPFPKIAKSVIRLAVESGIPEELIDSVHCVFDGELELWVIGTRSATGVEPDYGELLTIADDCELWMKTRKNRRKSAIRFLPPVEEIVADVPSLEAGRVNRCKSGLPTRKLSNSHCERALDSCDIKKSSRRPAQRRKMRNTPHTKGTA